ncbi:hypothetical protein F2Q68_00044968 [Brassica cretica]|uniref:Enhanced disease resistance 4-like N-terminal domain-containing protein n=1 Tax=Brassica cretica TaxID=69181 RepID=A0A8S9LSW7_BRACR|nr:hypothetical protein F2Q68_00044968 [Brassica cretica]
MMKKKKHSRSQSSSKKTIEPSPDSSPSPSPRLLSIFRSKLVSGKDLKHMFRGMKTKTAPGLSSQSRIVRCPKCHKLLQEPIDATIYKCSGCNSILQAKRWDLESNGDSIPEALLYSQNRSLSTQLESAEAGSKTPMRSTHREYNSRASPSVERGYDSETVYKHETSDVHREWMRRADEFSVTGESDAFASARSSPYNSRSNASEWTHHERRYQVPFYPASPSPSSAYEYGYNSPFHGSQASASEQSYYHHHQPNQFKQKEREGWFQESSAASPIRFPERSEEACSEKSTEMDNTISERVSCVLEEVGLYEKNETLEPEVMFGDGSGESLEVPVYKKERMSDSSIEAERVADKPVSHSGETRVLSESTGDTQEFDWEETREKEEYGGEGKWEDSMGDKPVLVLETSRYTGDSICDNSSSNGEAYEDTKIISAAPQNENQRFIGQSGEDTVTTSRTHEEQSKYENLSERDTTIRDSVRYIVSEESRYDTGKVSEDGSAVSLTKASETFSTSIEGERGEERSASHQMDLLPNENVEDSYERLEYAGERTWEEETMEDRAGLHLEEYESNYENYSKPFEWISEGASAFHNHMHEPKLGTINEPDEDADGRLKSSSRGSFSDHESSEESAVFQESSQDAQSKYEYEIPSERQELSNTERHEIQEEDRYEINETFGPTKMVEDGSVVSLEKTGERECESLCGHVLWKSGVVRI